MFDVIRDEVRRHREHFGRRLHVGVFKLGGHGDFMQQFAFARAVRRRWPRPEAAITLVCKLSAPPEAAGPPPHSALRAPHSAIEQILQGCDFVDSCLEVPATDWRAAVQELAPAFDVFYDVQYVAGTYFRSSRRFAAEQAAANARLARYAYYYSRFPWSNAEIAETRQSQWEMLARSSGLDVSEEDLFIRPEDEQGVGGRGSGVGGPRGEEGVGGPRGEEGIGRRGLGVGGPKEDGAEPRLGRPLFTPNPQHLTPNTRLLPPTPPSGVPHPHALPEGEGGRYVTLHNAAGGGAVVKCLSPGTFDALARRLRQLGLLPVQVGLPKETPIADCLDLRGLTMNGTAAAITGARLHVDIEGGLVYVARAVGTRSVVFFGPTPVVTFGFRSNINVSLGRCRPCWWSREGWERACPKGHPHCRNLPDAPQALAAVEKALEAGGLARISHQPRRGAGATE